MADSSVAQELVKFLNAAPTPFHAVSVAEVQERQVGRSGDPDLPGTSTKQCQRPHEVESDAAPAWSAFTSLCERFHKYNKFAENVETQENFTQ